MGLMKKANAITRLNQRNTQCGINALIHCAMLLGSLPTVAWANSATLNAVGDATISSQEPDTKKGLSTQLSVAADPLSSRTLVKFDLSTLTAAGVTDVDIESASLTLDIEQTQNWPVTGELLQFSLGVHALLLPWNEREVTWRCDTTACSVDWYGGAFNTVESDIEQIADFNGAEWIPSETKITFDVTQDVLNAFNGGFDHGWLIKKVDESFSGAVAFKASEIGYAPKLTVTFNRDIDIHVPSVSILAPENDVFVGQLPQSIDIAYNDDVSGVDVSSLQVLLNDTDITALCPAPGTVSVSCSLPETLSNGVQLITVNIRDLSGKLGANSSSFTYFADQSASQSQWTNAGGNVYTDASVGIGTDSPNSALHVVGSITTTDNIVAANIQSESLVTQHIQAQTLQLDAGATLGNVDVANSNSAASVGYVQGEVNTVTTTVNTTVSGLNSQVQTLATGVQQNATEIQLANDAIANIAPEDPSNELISAVNYDAVTQTLSITEGGTVHAQVMSGIQGEIGPEGPAGPQGVKGDTGDTGAIGPAGPQGMKGDKGDTGATGPAGPQGVKGDKGDTGATGPAGPQGIKGDKGDTGATGPVGPQGVKGDSGTSSWVDASGKVTTGVNVGIGTSSPAAKLHVNGNIVANNPTAGSHLATKSYVDAQVANISAAVGGGLKFVAFGYQSSFRTVSCGIQYSLKNPANGQSYMGIYAIFDDTRCECREGSVLISMSGGQPRTSATGQFACVLP